MIGKITIALIAALIAFIIGVRMIAHRAPRPDRLGVAGSKLLPCPDKPNCASSLEGLEPFPHSGDRGAAHATLLGILKTWPRTEVIQTTNDYIHVEFRSRVFSFIDDGEFYLVTELAEYSLHDFIKERKESNHPLSLEEVQQITAEMVCSIAGLHSKGLVHLDIKPENFMCFAGRWITMNKNYKVRSTKVRRK